MNELRSSLERIANNRANAGAIRYFHDSNLEPRPVWMEDAMRLEKMVDDELHTLIEGMEYGQNETEKLLVGPDEAAKMLGMSRSSLLRGDRRGEIGPRPKRIGRKLLWSAEELAAWCRYGCEPRVKWMKTWKELRDGQCRHTDV